MAGTDINRGTAGVVLPPEVSAEIWSNTLAESVVMQRAQKVTLPGAGKTVQIITGEGSAKFVAETGRKPLSNPTLGSKTMSAFKVALVESFSDEFARDKKALFEELKRRMPASLAKTFDQAALHGVGAPTSNFDNLGSAPEVELTSTNAYQALLASMASVAAAKGTLDGIALAGSGEVALLGAVDTVGRPIFTTNPATDGKIGSALGRPVYVNQSVYSPAVAHSAETVGIAGEWSTAYWGSVEGVRYEEYGGPIYNADGTLVHAGRQDNMISTICEFEIGFIVRDVARFVRLTTGSAVA